MEEFQISFFQMIIFDIYKVVTIDKTWNIMGLNESFYQVYRWKYRVLGSF